MGADRSRSRCNRAYLDGTDERQEHGEQDDPFLESLHGGGGVESVGLGGWLRDFNGGGRSHGDGSSLIYSPVCVVNGGARPQAFISEVKGYRPAVHFNPVIKDNSTSEAAERRPGFPEWGLTSRPPGGGDGEGPEGGSSSPAGGKIRRAGDTKHVSTQENLNLLPGKSSDR